MKPKFVTTWVWVNGLNWVTSANLGSDISSIRGPQTAKLAADSI